MKTNKPVTVHELIKFLQAVPNQNLPLQIVAKTEVSDPCDVGTWFIIGEISEIITYGNCVSFFTSGDLEA